MIPQKNKQIPSQVLLLAAGEGKRLAPFANGNPKSLIVLNESGLTLLEILLEQLKRIGIEKIYISAGYQYELFQSQLEQIQLNISPLPEIILIDARPDCQKGPIYSFLAAQSYFQDSSFFFLLPADTLFSLNFLNQILKKNYDLGLNHLFYSINFVESVPMPSQIRLKNINRKYVDDILSNKEPPIENSNYTRIQKTLPLLPILLLTQSFFDYAKERANNGDLTVIQALKHAIHESFDVEAHEITVQDDSFQDLDTVEDFDKIQTILSNKTFLY